MFNKTDEISPATTENNETAESAVEETAVQSDVPEARPKGFEKPGSGFLWYIQHPVSEEEALQRIADLPKRGEKIIAAIRKSKDRDISA